jgi:hypothetical protein
LFGGVSVFRTVPNSPPFSLAGGDVPWKKTIPLLESRARYAAKRVGLRAKKSRRRKATCDNHGRFMLIEPIRNIVVAGERFELKPETVISICEKIQSG